MQPTYKKETLSFYQAQAWTNGVDLSKYQTRGVASAAGKYLKDNSSIVLGEAKGAHQASPEACAVTFYALNHLMALLRRKYGPYDRMEDKHAALAGAYNASLMTIGVRMFYYLLLICTRETRHVYQDANTPFFKKLAEKYNQPCATFLDSIRGSGSEGAVQRFLDYAPGNTPIGVYTSFMEEVFRKGSFSSSFGGKKWADIALVLRDFTLGRLSMEMMLDTAFTLQHNGNVLFNKGLCFQHEGAMLKKILDVQRAGMIPRWVVTETSDSFAAIKKTLVLYKDLMPDLSEPINWAEVKKLGAIGHYGESSSEYSSGGYVKPVPKDLKSLVQKVPNKNAVEIYPGCYLSKMDDRPK